MAKAQQETEVKLDDNNRHQLRLTRHYRDATIFFDHQFFVCKYPTANFFV